LPSERPYKDQGEDKHRRLDAGALYGQKASWRALTRNSSAHTAINFREGVTGNPDERGRHDRGKLL
jgi:hypothetical protein